MRNNVFSNALLKEIQKEREEEEENVSSNLTTLRKRDGNYKSKD